MWAVNGKQDINLTGPFGVSTKWQNSRKRLKASPSAIKALQFWVFSSNQVVYWWETSSDNDLWKTSFWPSGVIHFSNYGVLTGAQQKHVIYTITWAAWQMAETFSFNLADFFFFFLWRVLNYVGIAFSTSIFLSPTCLSQLTEIMHRLSLLIHQSYCNLMRQFLPVLHIFKFHSVSLPPRSSHAHISFQASVQLISLFWQCWKETLLLTKADMECWMPAFLGGKQ